MENTFHIYDKNLKHKEFYFFFGTWIEECDTWDKNSYYHGFLITINDIVIPTKIPYLVYKQIPDKLKRSPINNQYHRFKISQDGSVISNIEK